MKQYRGVLLDADNTIFNYDKSESAALDETLAEAAPGVARAQAVDTYRDINARYWKRFEAGEVDATALQTGRWKDFFSAFGLRGDPKKTAVDYVASLSRQAHLLPGAAEAVRALAGRTRLGLVTNGLSLVQRGRLDRSGLSPFFSSVVISEEIGRAKPDPRFFQAAVESLGLPAAALLCVGDNPVADVGGARAAGIDAWWFSPNGAPWPGPGEAPRVVKDLSEILPMLHGP